MAFQGLEDLQAIADEAAGGFGSVDVVYRAFDGAETAMRFPLDENADPMGPSGEANRPALAYPTKTQIPAPKQDEQFTVVDTGRTYRIVAFHDVEDPSSWTIECRR